MGKKEGKTEIQKFEYLKKEFMKSFYLFLIILFLSVNAALHFAKKSLFNAAKIYMLKLEYKSETANTTCIIYHLNSYAV